MAMVENNWRQAWIALRFFLIWGLCFGGLLGFVSGALIFPLFGATLSTPWGLGIGAGLGALVGAIAAAASLFAPITPNNVQNYRRRLSLTLGALVAVAAPLLVHLTSINILWYPSGYYDWRTEFRALYPVPNAFWLPSMLAAAFWGALSAAYVAHRFAEYCALNVQVGQDTTTQTPVVDHPNDIPIYWMGKFVSRWWLYPVMMVVGGLVNYGMQLAQHQYYSSYNSYTVAAPSFTGHFVIGAMAGIFYAFGAGLLMGASNGLLLTFLNRIGFLEYAPDMAEARYRRVVTAITASFTLVMGTLMTFGALSPQRGPLMGYESSLVALLAGLVAAGVAAFTAGRIAQDYAPRYFAARSKRKSLPKDTALLTAPVVLGDDGELMPDLFEAEPMRAKNGVEIL
jgi:MFS family permease